MPKLWHRRRHARRGGRLWSMGDFATGPELPFMLIALDYCYQLKADMIPTAAHAGMPRKKGRISTFDAVAKPEGVRILGFLLIIRKQ